MGKFAHRLRAAADDIARGGLGTVIGACVRAGEITPAEAETLAAFFAPDVPYIVRRLREEADKREARRT